MSRSVIKRDGRREEFLPEKIIFVVLKAMNETEKGPDPELAQYIANSLTGENEQKASSLQKKIEKALKDAGRDDAAKKFRAMSRARAKERNAETDQALWTVVDAQANEITRENANMNADTPAGMMMKFASETSKRFSTDNLLSKRTLNAVQQNLIHIHDLDYMPTRSLTCLQSPLDKILKDGFKAGHGESRPAKRIETASMLACIALETAQNEMHGGQAIPAFDFYMAPYVRASYLEEVEKLRPLFGHLDGFDSLKSFPVDEYVKKDIGAMSLQGLHQWAVNNTVSRVHQAMESFVHNCNTIHSRGGNQVVFSSINYGTDTSAEGRCVIRELLKTTMDGVGNGSTAIFPIQIWKKKRGVNFEPGEPNYDLFEYACEVSGRRFFPNFLNLDASFNQSPFWNADDPKRYEHEVATMGCRTRVYENRRGPVTSIGRGNLSFTTINLPRLAIESNKDIDLFFSRLGEVCDIAAEQLHERYEFQRQATAKQFPFIMSGLWLGSEKLKADDKVGDVLDQGTLGIGFIGLAECLVALTGKHHAESESSQELGIRIVTYMRDKVKGYAEKYDLNYSVLATPAEGLSGKFTRRDREEFGVIKGVTDKDYYTNSNHVPVYFKCSPVEKARIESPYHDLTRGGHIFYIEADGDASKNPRAVMDFVKLLDKYNMGYGSVNHNRNRCLDCGHEDAEAGETVCPCCGSENIDTLQRITGYLVGTTSRWNSGKLAELKDRVTHTDAR